MNSELIELLVSADGRWNSLSFANIPALLQWGNELRRWSPTLDFVSYAGSMAEREDIRRQYKKQKRKGEGID